MTIIDALVDVLGQYPDEYVWILYVAAVVVFILFMHWVFVTISRFLFDYVLQRRK